LEDVNDFLENTSDEESVQQEEQEESDWSPSDSEREADSATGNAASAEWNDWFDSNVEEETRIAAANAAARCLAEAVIPNATATINHLKRKCGHGTSDAEEEEFWEL
jgi:hypothetical protein